MPLRSMNTWSLSTKSALVALETRSEKQDVKGDLILEGEPGIFVKKKDSEKSEFLLGACTVHEPPMKVTFADTCTALQITVESNKDVKEELGKTGGKTDEKYPIQFEPKAQIDQADTDPTDPFKDTTGDDDFFSWWNLEERPTFQWRRKNHFSAVKKEPLFSGEERTTFQR